MKKAGLIEAIGNTNNRSYTLSAKLYKNPADYVRQTGIDQLRYCELIHKLAQTSGEISRKDVVNLLHVSPPQAYDIHICALHQKIMFLLIFLYNHHQNPCACLPC